MVRNGNDKHLFDSYLPINICQIAERNGIWFNSFES